MGRIRLIYFFILIGIFSCENRKLDNIGNLINDVKEQYAPDKRTAIFDLIVVQGNPVVIIGETNIPKAKEALIDMLDESGYAFEDSITVLPDKRLSEDLYAIINVSVANLRSQPKYSAELVTQALLGTTGKVLKKKGGWYLIQTPDQYIAWASGSNLVVMSDHDFEEWKQDNKLIYLPTYGFSVDSVGGKVSDLVAGNVFVLQGENTSTWIIKYPDSRIAMIGKEDAEPTNDWIENISITENSLISTAKDLMGVPYLWGGTSTKGVDCSGFTKTVFLRHGLILPRDASQQVNVGKLIDDQRDFSKLEVGDLLFFGRKNEDGSERVIHVGLWIGDNSFIHSSGDVHISSMDSLADNYDSYNYNRYLRTKRVLGFESDLPIEFQDIY